MNPNLENGQWDDGSPITAEEYIAAVVHLVKMGLVSISLDEHNEIVLKATDAGHAVYEIEMAMRHLEEEVSWPDEA